MRARLVLLLAVTAAAASADLVHKAVTVAGRGDSMLFHERPGLYTLGLGVGFVWALALLATGSRGLAAVGGIVLGGAFANALSLALWPSHDGVPNPFFVRGEDFWTAFNLADVFVVVGGFVLVPIAVLVFALRNRERLRERVAFRP